MAASRSHDACGPEARRRLWAVIGNLTAAGTTVLLTTHYLEEARRLARRVIVLSGGRIVADATPDQLRARGGPGPHRRWRGHGPPARHRRDDGEPPARGHLGALTLALVGTAVTILIPTAQSANPVLMITYLPLILFSGAFGSISGLPHWLGNVMSHLPAQPLIDAATRALDNPGGGFTGVSGRDVALLAAWAAIGAAVSVRFFRWDPHRPAHARVSARVPS